MKIALLLLFVQLIGVIGDKFLINFPRQGKGASVSDNRKSNIQQGEKNGHFSRDQINNLLRVINPFRSIEYYDIGRVEGMVFEASDSDLDILTHFIDVEIFHDDEIEVELINWGLDRLDQQELPLDKNVFNSLGLTGKGQRIYILDTGIHRTHSEFTGRIEQGINLVNNNNTVTDVFGHGTPCASVAAGTKHGVAKEATIIPVKVLKDNGRGAVSTAIKAIEWCMKDKANYPEAGAVMSFSFSTPYVHPELNELVNEAAHSGIIVVTAAGNQAMNASLRSPGSAEKAITVGASDDHDRFAWFSNYGPAVDIYAPGVDVIGAGTMHDTHEVKKSGTSFAAPHVTGVVALLLQKYNGRASYDDIMRELLSNSIKGVLSGDGISCDTKTFLCDNQSPNRLLSIDPVQFGVNFLSHRPTNAPTPQPSASPTSDTVSVCNSFTKRKHCIAAAGCKFKRRKCIEKPTAKPTPLSIFTSIELKCLHQKKKWRCKKMPDCKWSNRKCKVKQLP